MKIGRNRIPFLVVGSFIFMVFSLIVSPSITYAQSPTPATTGCDGYFLSIPAWYNGIATPASDGGCDIAGPSEVGGIGPFVWTIALNVVEIMLNIVGYSSVGFIIYGGYKYMISAGSPDGMVSARKTITNAVIGLVISVLAIGIVNFVAKNLGA